MPSAADVPAADISVANIPVGRVLATSQPAVEEPCPPLAEDAVARVGQVASLPECKDCAVPAVAVERPGNRPYYSPIGQAVLELLRSQGGGHLRP
jgi:hypothetical protein